MVHSPMSGGFLMTKPRPPVDTTNGLGPITYPRLFAAASHSAPHADLLLLYLSLPGLSGLSALETFRQRHPELPIVVLSSTEDPRVVLQALEAGAMGFIPKSSPTPVLLRALQLVASGGVYVPEQ